MRNRGARCVRARAAHTGARSGAQERRLLDTTTPLDTSRTMRAHAIRSLLIVPIGLAFAPSGGRMLTPPRARAPSFLPPRLDAAGGGEGQPRRGRAMPALLANLLLALAVLVFLADVAAMLVPGIGGIATTTLIAVPLVAGAAAIAGLAAEPRSDSRPGADVGAAGCVALLACLDLLSRAFQQEGSTLVAATTLSACMAVVAAMLAIVARGERGPEPARARHQPLFPVDQCPESRTR
jgi:hypothetical protein